MDKRGHCHDNVFVERLWWTLKHERGLSRSAVSPGSLVETPLDDVPIKRPVGRRRTRRISARANYKAIVEACCIAEETHRRSRTYPINRHSRIRHNGHLMSRLV